MKYFLLLSIVVVRSLSVQGYHLSSQQKLKLKTHIAYCVREAGIAEDVVIKARETGEYTDEEKLSQYYFCMYKRLDMMSDDGEFLNEGIKKKLPVEFDHEMANKLINICTSVVGDTKYIKALNAYKCYREHPELHQYKVR